MNYSDRGGLWLEIGKSTTIPIELTNRDTETVDDLRISVESDATWLDAAMAGDCKPVPGAQKVWSVPRMEAHGRRLPLTVQVTVRANLPAAAAAAGAAPAAAEPTPPMEQANLRFVLWRTGGGGTTPERLRPGSGHRAGAQLVADGLPGARRAAGDGQAARADGVAPGHGRPRRTAADRDQDPQRQSQRAAEKPEARSRVGPALCRSLDKRKDGLAGWITGREVTNVKTDTSVADVPGLNVIAPNSEGSFSVGLRVAKPRFPAPPPPSRSMCGPARRAPLRTRGCPSC
ncbi:MAG: hypothetical protein U1F77_01980 [Kiritimatiellia bacterium]